MYDENEFRRLELLRLRTKQFIDTLLVLKPGQAEKIIKDDYNEIEKMKKLNSQADRFFEEAEKSYQEAEENKDPYIGKYNAAVEYYSKAARLYHEAGDAVGELKALEKLRDFYKPLDERSAENVWDQTKLIRKNLYG